MSIGNESAIKIGQTPLRRFLLNGSLAALGLLGASGCGGTGDLTGKVTFKSQPLRMGTVNVVGGDGIVASGTIQDDGAYTVTGIGIGEVRIAVSSVNPAKQKVGTKPKAGLVAPKADASNWIAIPEHYGDFDRSGLTLSLQRGENSFPIELK